MTTYYLGIKQGYCHVKLGINTHSNPDYSSFDPNFRKCYYLYTREEALDRISKFDQFAECTLVDDSECLYEHPIRTNKVNVSKITDVNDF